MKWIRWYERLKPRFQHRQDDISDRKHLIHLRQDKGRHCIAAILAWRSMTPEEQQQSRLPKFWGKKKRNL